MLCRRLRALLIRNLLAGNTFHNEFFRSTNQNPSSTNFEHTKIIMSQYLYIDNQTSYRHQNLVSSKSIFWVSQDSIQIEHRRLVGVSCNPSTLSIACSLASYMDQPKRLKAAWSAGLRGSNSWVWMNNASQPVSVQQARWQQQEHGCICCLRRAGWLTGSNSQYLYPS